MLPRRPLALALSVFAVALLARAQPPAPGSVYPAVRPSRAVPPPPESRFTIHADRPKQLIRGLGFEIQSDSIASANAGLPAALTSVPHDLVPAERARFAREMLAGFRTCRLAGGLYWRGLDAEQKYLQPRWPEQLVELRELLSAAGIEGVSLEYWSPAPFWKANRAYTGVDRAQNILRCFGKNFADDPDYHGDVARFLKDFAEALRRDLATLRAAGIPVSMWGLQNEPESSGLFSTCLYAPADYAKTFLAVAPVVRAFDPKITIIADTAYGWDFRFIRPVLDDPATAGLVDALVVHHVGSNANAVRPPPEPSGKPRFQNEYEYQPSQGPASPDKCLNTVQHLMNWFQLGDAPTWFWIHALKPYKNAEASGYSLGFWRPIDDLDDSHYPAGLKPGHWIWNKYNWHAVGSFIRHMPWDCRSVAVTEEISDDDLRIMAFTRPNGKLTVVLSNRSHGPHTFRVDTGLDGKKFRGVRYTPDAPGPEFRGVPLGTLSGRELAAQLPDLAWEFWEEL